MTLQELLGDLTKQHGRTLAEANCAPSRIMFLSIALTLTVTVTLMLFEGKYRHLQINMKRVGSTL